MLGVDKLAESAVHCAFAGYTNFSIGMINNKPCMIPLEKMCGINKRKVSYNSEDYLMLLSSTGQPSFYPENNEENKEIKEKEENKEKNELKENEDIKENKENKDKEENKIEKLDKKDSIDYGVKNDDNDNKKNIFNFH